MLTNQIFSIRNIGYQQKKLMVRNTQIMLKATIFSHPLTFFFGTKFRSHRIHRRPFSATKNAENRIIYIYLAEPPVFHTIWSVINRKTCGQKSLKSDNRSPIFLLLLYQQLQVSILARVSKLGEKLKKWQEGLLPPKDVTLGTQKMEL